MAGSYYECFFLDLLFPSSFLFVGGSLFTLLSSYSSPHTTYSILNDRLWGRMLISRQMFIDFAAMEGFQYPEDFVLLVEAIDGDRESPLAVRYRKLMMDVMGPIQHECQELIMNKKWLFTSEGELSEYLIEYMLMVNSYKIIFSRWETGNYDVHFSSRRFPPELIETLQQQYLDAKQRVDEVMKSLYKKPTVREGLFSIFRPLDENVSGIGTPGNQDKEKIRRKRFSPIRPPLSTS